MQILSEHQIHQKIKRLAIQILENNFREKEIILIGINRTGMRFAELIHQRLEKVSDINFSLANIRINPAEPISEPVHLNIDLKNLEDQVVILIDDVANSGRTLFYACKPLFEVLPKRVETAVLVDRTHKHFPINVNYVGLSLATTLKQNISVKLLNVEEMFVSLE